MLDLRELASRERLVVVAAAIALGVCLVVTGAMIGVQRSWVDARANEAARASQQVAALASTLDRGLSAVSRALNDSAVGAIRALDGPGAPDWAEVERMLRLTARANPDILRIGISDAGGIVRGTSSPESHPAGVAIGGQEFFAVHRDGRSPGVWVSRPLMAPSIGDPIIAVSRAVRAEDGRFLGVVTAAVPSTRFFADWMAPAGGAARIGLLRLDGALLHGDPDLPRAGVDVADVQALLGPQREAGAAIRAMRPARGDHGIFVWQLVPETPLVVVATVAADEVWRAWLEARRGEYAGGLIVVLLSVGLGVALFRAVRRAIDAEARLRLSTERRFRDAIEQMVDGVLIADAEDRIVAWNRRYVEMQPYAASVLRVGLPIRDLIAHVFACLGAVGEQTLSIDARIANRARCEGFEFATLSGRLVEARDQRLKDGGIITIFRDVTEERRLLDQLTRSEARFRDFASTTSDWLWETDAEDRFTYVSHGVRAIGLQPQDLIGKPRHAFAGLLGDSPHQVRARVDAAYSAREPFKGLGGVIRRPDGSELHIEIDGRPLFDAEGRFAGYRGGARDVTKMREAERRLAESERRARDYAEEGSDWMWETGPDGRFTFISEGVRRFGLTPDQFVGRTRVELPYKVPSDSPGLIEVMRAVAAREPFREKVFPGLLADGRTIQISLTGWPRYDAEGAFLGFRGVGRDVADRIRQQEELTRALVAEREMNQQQRRFIAIASHEFRTPLAVIDGAAQRILARVEALGDADIIKRLDRIRAAVKRMTDIIESTLSTARLDEGHIALQVEPIDLTALLHEVCERQRSVSDEFTIYCDVPPRLAIDGDPRLLDQVFTNLLSNAIKYSGRQRRVEIVATATLDSATVTVRDFGLGIAPEDRARLFQRFYRAATAQGIAGTGIGLYLVRELVRLHGGTIDVASEVGRGSTFTVTLRRRIAHAETGAAA